MNNIIYTAKKAAPAAEQSSAKKTASEEKEAASQGAAETTAQPSFPWQTAPVLWTGAAVVILLAAVTVLWMLTRKKKKRPDREANVPQKGVKSSSCGKKSQSASSQADYISEMTPLQIIKGSAQTLPGAVGRVHNVGSRPSQQDSFGVVTIRNGVFAVVADGMGGLSDGDKVSQKVVLTMMQDASRLKETRPGDRQLYSMLAHANEEVNDMLGASSRYKSGSTVIAVLTQGRSFQWIAVGDSRIYLFRGGRLLQLNVEHTYEKELLLKAVNQQISFAEAETDKQRSSVTSFVGMGELKHVEGSTRAMEMQPGDRLLLMSDGIFNTLSEQEIAAVLSGNADAQEAAAELEEQVLARQNPKQDNFTAVILDY